MMNKKLAGLLTALLAALWLLPSGVLAAETKVVKTIQLPAVQERVVVQDNTTDDIDPFSVYVAARLYGVVNSGVSPLSTEEHTAGSRLSGIDKQFYNLLADKIKNVAENGGSTEFKFDVKEIFNLDDLIWTFEELGLNNPTNDELDAKIEAALEAVYEKINLNWFSVEEPEDPENPGNPENPRHRALVSSLMADFPYEMYWYDKLAGFLLYPSGVAVDEDGNPVLDQDGTPTLDPNNMDYSYGISTGEDTTGLEKGTAYISFSDLIYVFSFSVSQEFQPDNSTDSFSVDNKVKTIGQAAENAATIIANVNEDKTPYEALKAYKDAICELTSYNVGAAEDDSTPYGNPWQLIYVFDGDPDTNVVCEGYAKAFQYLCDLGSACGYLGDVQCYTASGLMQGGTGEGLHMWNIVSIDGANYIVDVTNCDGDAIGAPDALFLAGAQVSTEIVSADEVPTYVVTIPGKIDSTTGEATKISYSYDSKTVNLWWGENSPLKLSSEPYTPKDTRPNEIESVEFQSGKVSISAHTRRQSVLIAAAAYDGDGKLLGNPILHFSTSTSGNTSDGYSHIMDPTTLPEGTTTVKIFLLNRNYWVPLCEAETRPEA